VLGYRSKPFIDRGYFESIKKATNLLNDAKLVFLDNYSRDGAITYLIDRYYDIDILLSPRNYMYCRAVNYGLQYIYHRYNPNYYILVDSDNPCDINAYCQLVNYIKKHPSAGMVQPVVRKLQNPSLIYSCGHYIDEDYNCRTIKELPDDLSELDDLKSCSISSTLIKKDLFLKCGLLDTRYELYWESMDLAYRARKEGFKCACCPTAFTFNEGGYLAEVDSFHERYYRIRNKIIFYWKNDKDIFNLVMPSLNKMLEQLEDKNRKSEFGLSVSEEATRQGILDGLTQIQKEESFIPSIVDYRKGNVILLR
jgi:GT2 family glycosyltransferase